MCGGLNDHIKPVLTSENKEKKLLLLQIYLLKHKLKKQKLKMQECEYANQILITSYQSEHDMRRIAEAKVIALCINN
jgi:hypothetical protein